MDVALASSSICLATLLPSPCNEDNKWRSSRNDLGSENQSTRRGWFIRVSLLLSLFLLSLAVLEISPASWLTFLDNTWGSYRGGEIITHDGRFSLTETYRVVLWAECLLVAVAMPAAAGSSIVLSIASLFSGSAIDVLNQSAHGKMRDKGTNGPMVVSRILRGILLGLCSALNLMLLAPKFVFYTVLRCALVALKRRRGKENVIPRTISSGQIENSSKRSMNSTSSTNVINRTTPGGLFRFTCRESTTISFKMKASAIGALLGLIFSLTALEFLGSLVVEWTEDDRNGSDLRPSLGRLVSKISAVGVLVSQLLNGFGCVSLPYSCLSGIYLDPISNEHLSSAQENLECIQKDMSNKRAMLADWHLRCDQHIPVIPLSTHFHHLYRRRCLSGNVQVIPNRSTVDSLQKEVNFLETLIEELEDDIESMKELQTSAAASRTVFGRFKGWIGIIFSMILLIRVSLALMALMCSGRGPISSERADPITMILLWLVRQHLVTQEDYNSLSQCISLILTAFLGLSQVNTFLRAISAMRRRIFWLLKTHIYQKVDNTMTRKHVEHKAVEYLTASMIGCYFTACAVLMKRNLPLEYRLAFVTALGESNFRFNLKVINATFAVSALGSLFCLLSLFGIRRQNSSIHRAQRLCLPETFAVKDFC